MMTTKVFQRILATFLVVAAIFLANGLNNVANAAIVQIYDGSVNDILNDVKKTTEFMKNDSRFSNYYFTLRGTHYYTGTDGFRYCESYFGDSDKNRIVFNVNNNGAVSSAWIILPVYTMSGEWNEKGGEISGMLCGSIFDVIGLSDNESNNIMDSFSYWIDSNMKKTKLNEVEKVKTFSVWCTKSKRYINLKASFNNIESADKANINLFIYANT